MGINAFARGMRSVNPKAEVKVIWVNSWFDPGREREAADTLISQGADVRHAPHRLDRRRAGRRGEEGLRGRLPLRHVEVRPERAAHRGHAPLGRLLHARSRRRRSTASGSRTTSWGGIKDGMIKMAPFNKVVPQDVQDLVKKTEADIGAGKFHPFTGPIKDNEGKERARRRQDDRRRRRCPRWTTTSRACRASCPSSPPGEPAPRPRRPPSELAPERPGPFSCLAPCPDGWAAEKRAAARCELSDRDRSRSCARGRGSRWWLPALPLRRSAFRRARRRSPVRRRFPW